MDGRQSGRFGQVPQLVERAANPGQDRDIDDLASHASWMENFPWTRLAGVAQPEERKPLVDFDRMRAMGPEAVRALLGDGNFGGLYQRPDQEMLAIWATGVEETRAMIEGPWR